MVFNLRQDLFEHIKALLDFWYFDQSWGWADNFEQSFGVIKFMFQVIVGIFRRQRVFDGLIRVVKAFAKLFWTQTQYFYRGIWIAARSGMCGIHYYCPRFDYAFFYPYSYGLADKKIQKFFILKTKFAELA